MVAAEFWLLSAAASLKEGAYHQPNEEDGVAA
jgi:hypothetical protein